MITSGNNNATRFWTLSGLVLAAGLSRLLPHPFNFTPIAAMALFGGAYYGRSALAFIVPFAAMLLSDVVIGFHSTTWAVYLSFALIVLLGIKFLGRASLSKVMMASLMSSVLFFLITNFAAWMSLPSLYPQTSAGLMASYIAGLQFYQNSLFGNFFLNQVIGDFFYTGVLFGVFEWMKSRSSVLRMA